MKFGIIGRQGTPQIQDSLSRVYQYLAKTSHEVNVECDTASLMPDLPINGVSREELTQCTHLVVVGGDGSILGVARDFAKVEIPVIGVNRGGLGFLADVSPDQIEDGLAAVIRGDFRQEKHFLLDLSVYRAGERIGSTPALNDVVVSSGSLAKMMDFSLYINDEFVYSQYSDGVIISTPTGSTAYSLSAGGPIMHPSLDAIAIVPMFPHTLTSRPLVVEGSTEIKIVPGSLAKIPQVSADSQIEFDLQTGDEVHVCKYPHAIELIHPITHSFYEACRSKLDWASRLGQPRESD